MKGGGDKYDWMEVNDQMKCMISLSRIRYMIYALLRNIGGISMSEAIISRRGSKGGNGGSGGGTPELRTETITVSGQWKVPKTYNNMIDVRIFGGGSGGAMSQSSAAAGGGGGGGWMNNKVFDNLPVNSNIYITIGRGAAGVSTYQGERKAGGTSSFGTYLSENGADGMIGAWYDKGCSGGAGGGEGYLAAGRGGEGATSGSGGGGGYGKGGNGGGYDGGFGAGGGGNGAGNGGNGGNGVCIIQYYVLV